MNLFRKLADRWHEWLNRDPGVSDVRNAPDVSVVGTGYDALLMEEELVKPPKKGKS